jgi:hypothetical protein
MRQDNLVATLEQIRLVNLENRHWTVNPPTSAGGPKSKIGKDSYQYQESGFSSMIEMMKATKLEPMIKPKREPMAARNANK